MRKAPTKMAALAALAGLMSLAQPEPARANDAWAVTSQVDNSVLPASAQVLADGTASALVEHRSDWQSEIRRRLLVAGCLQGQGLVSVEDDDTGFGVQLWHSRGGQVFDMLAVRVCNAAQQTKNIREAK